MHKIHPLVKEMSCLVKKFVVLNASWRSFMSKKIKWKQLNDKPTLIG